MTEAREKILEARIDKLECRMDRHDNRLQTSELALKELKRKLVRIPSPHLPHGIGREGNQTGSDPEGQMTRKSTTDAIHELSADDIKGAMDAVEVIKGGE